MRPLYRVSRIYASYFFGNSFVNYDSIETRVGDLWMMENKRNLQDLKIRFIFLYLKEKSLTTCSIEENDFMIIDLRSI